jgi:uncharacterized coiled-coil DUF342 family protein
MTRIKEPEIGSNQIPDYKSPSSRIIRSLRTGYDNLRAKVTEKSSQLDSIRGKLRDVTCSRDEWKKEAKTSQEELKKLQLKQRSLEAELENLKKKR